MFDTAGQYHPFFDMCGCCEMDTGGNHKDRCPCNPNSIYAQLTKQGLEDIKHGRYKKLIDVKRTWPEYQEV